MATPTTTFAAIRRQMVTTIKALTPASVSGEPYRLTESEAPDFRDWAKKDGGARFREYEISSLGRARIGPADHAVELSETTCELVIAYPHTWGTFAGQQVERTQGDRAAMLSLIDADLLQIAKAIGVKGAANYVSGQHSAIETGWSYEHFDGVTFGVLPMTVTFYTDVS